MQKTKKKQEQSFETVLEVKKYLGMNTANRHTALIPGESRLLKNCDIYSGPEGDYIKSRRGSQVLKKASAPAKRATFSVYTGITWDTGSEEYLITQEDSGGMYYQALLTVGNPVAIALATGGAFALGSDTPADLFISGDKLYVVHPSANYVIRWTGSAFEAYPMGLAFPWIIATTSANAGVITGSYTWGIEKVYRVSGVDLMASTPNRRTTASPSVLAVSGTVTTKKLKMTIRATELDNDSLWTHLRVWRSKNKNSDNTDPLNPLDPQGTDDELYEEALITKAEIGAGALTAIATGTTLPPGNVGTTAGKPAGVYTIEVNNLDSVFFNLIGIDRIELLPIPAATCGCFCGNRIFVSGIQDTALDDASKNNIWYSNYAGTKYAFQYNPLNFVDTGRDGQNMMRLIAFEKDLIGIKEAKTGRLPSANPDLLYQTLDEKIGIAYKNFAAFIPTIGIAAIVNDNSDFRIFGYDLRWTNIVNGLDVSLPVRSLTATYDSTRTNFIYINGKIVIWDGSSSGPGAMALHIREKRGWTQNVYSIGSSPNFAFVFAAGTRAGVASGSSYLAEIEVSALNTDANPFNEVVAGFNLEETTHCFQSNEGRDILEFEYLSLNGYATGAMNTIPYVNTLTWPNPVSPTTIFFTRSGVSPTYDALNDGEHQLFIQPQTVGAFKWCPMVGNFLSFNYLAPAPATLRGKALHCIVDQNGLAWGAFDPFQTFPTANNDPYWAH